MLYSIINTMQLKKVTVMRHSKGFYYIIVTENTLLDLEFKVT